MTIHVSLCEIPSDMIPAAQRFSSVYGMVVVRIADLQALEAAKARFEQAWLDLSAKHPTLESRAQRPSEAVAQHEEKQSPCLRPGDLNTHADIAPCTLHAENTFLLNELKTLSSAYARIIAFCQSNT